MTRWALVAGVAGLLRLGGGWYLLSSADGDPEANQEPPVRYWHCPKCGLEMTCPPGQEDAETLCLHCIHDKVAFQVVTRAQGQGAVLPVGHSRWVLGVGAGLAILLAAAVMALSRAQKTARVPKEERLHHCRCPGCSRKVRYPQSQAGCRMTCPDCNVAFALPAGNGQTLAPGQQEEIAQWGQQLLRERAAKPRRPR
jgi:hypothetical protein